MKKTILSLTLIFIASVFLMSNVYGQVAVKDKPVKSPQEKAKTVINKTSDAIYEARIAVKEGKNQTGDLAIAVKHQKFAQKLYAQQEYKKAAEHSLFARKHAVAACKANNRVVKPQLERQPKDEVAATLRPDSELINEVSKENLEAESEIIKGESENYKVE